MSNPALVQETHLTPAERVRLDAMVNRCMAIVAVPRFNEVSFDPSSGSGVLVRVAGRDFLATADHVIAFKDRDDIAIAFAREDGLNLPMKRGEKIRAIWKVSGPGDFDAAMIELDPEHAYYWKHHEPIDAADFVDWRSVPDDERLLVVGAPAERQSVENTNVPRQSPGERVIEYTRHVTSYGVSLTTRLRTGIANPDAPDDGRCFHVGWELHREYEGDRPRPIDPHGVSGGPVLRFERKRELVGIVRSAFAAKYLLCEPIVSAVRALLRHSDADVRREADAVVSRLAGTG